MDADNKTMESIMTQFVQAEPLMCPSVEEDSPVAALTDAKDIKERSKRQWLYRNDGDVAILCTHNNISESLFVNKSSSIKSLEMCFYNLAIISGFHNFENLTSICIVAQDIKEIEGLEDCPRLEQLWICETRVTRVQKLDQLVQLRQLFLYGNRIKKIEGLDTLTKLEKLWLSDNDISTLENMDSLINLQELKLGNNKVTSVNDALNNLVNLKDLNIAGNQIASFREVLFLSRLPRLTSLCLSDPNFADNPICSLCNYQTHVIYHLPNLRSLDTLEVTDESRRIISATVLKKRMYYNMRIRTIKRNTNFLVKLLDTRHLEEQSRLERDMVELMGRAKRAQKRWDDLVLASGRAKTPQTSSVTERLEHARIRLKQLIDVKSRATLSLQTHKEEIANQINQQSDMAIRKLLLELETGGNVRFEDEQREDAWFEACEALVKTFILRGTSRQAHKRVQIHRISRLHNRNLKNKFEGRLATKPESERNFEYLCYQPSSDHADEVFAAVEHGFSSECSPQQNCANGVVLSNFLECTDTDTIATTDGMSSQSAKILPQSDSRKKLRQAVIVKVYTWHVAKVPDIKNFVQTRSPQSFAGKDCIYQDFVPPNAAPLSPSEQLCDDPYRLYVVADRDLILPEYFVEYSLESDLDHLTTRVEKLMVDIAYSNKLSLADMPAIVTEVCAKLGNQDTSSGIYTMPMDKMEADHPEINIADDPEMFPPASASLNITHIALSHCGLDTIPNLTAFSHLEQLDVSFNNIRSIPDNFATVGETLKHLDLVKNEIADLPNAALDENFIILYESLTILAFFTALSKLRFLDLRFNPISKRKGFRKLAMKHLRSLSLLNGLPIDDAERISIVKPVTPDLIVSRSSTQPHLFRPLSVRTQSGYGSFAAQNDYWRMSHHPHLNEGMVVEALTTLELDSCHLFDLDLLPTGFVNLRWASFRNNHLTDISKLALYPHLEELSLENNEIETIDPLTSLTSLTKLDASNNRIEAVESASNFKSLMLLSLENNFLTNLKPFARMATLMEFYIGNNSISILLSIFPLKELPRLIILDLTGNSVCQVTNYRLFIIFHLARLKILDGAGISAKEQSAAKEVYLGKLTIELLGEKIGHFAFKNISELDLRSCRIREIDCFAGFDFRNLRRLNFDNNLLTNIDCFAGLSGLRSLSLNGNRIERLLSTDSPAPVVGNGVGMVGLGGGRIDTPESGKHRRPLLPYLEELHLGHNCVTRIADLGLWRFPHLKLMYLHGNKITKIDGLEHMTGLIELVLDKNQIKFADPSSFVSLINLRELHIKENRLKSLSHFDCLPNLQHLFLANNRIHETTEIEKMKLPSLLQISLASNAVARKHMYRYALIMRFPQILGIDGKDVTDEERQRAELCFMEQCMARDDPMTKLAASANVPPMVPSGMNSLVKLPIKITSVVLDGLEMRLDASTWRRGGNPQHSDR
ncbi:Leucine-rich repeat-containing protein 9 [Borealophlyctis nickersoniae]|nr:Leucine-rich repeat-containing protein 9 [Borealophlyctis nickersoniae]